MKMSADLQFHQNDGQVDLQDQNRLTPSIHFLHGPAKCIRVFLFDWDVKGCGSTQQIFGTPRGPAEGFVRESWNQGNKYFAGKGD